MAEDTFSCYVFDIQNRKEREEGKTRVSYRGDAGRFDALTGLPVERFDVNELFNRIHAILGKHGASIGFLPAIGATYSLGSASVYNLYDQASMACQEAKRDYKNRVMFFDPSMVSKAAEDYKILSDFREALRNGEITFHLQPFRIREFLNDTVYSDSMLNNIIGPAAIYVWHGDDVDIVRFNQQFYQSANVPDFDKRLLGIQRFMPENEAPLLLQLLQRAYDDRLNGSSGVLTFDRVGGDFSRYFIHFYFLNEDGKARRFYGASRDVTEMARLHSRLDLLARFTSRAVVFVVLKDGDYTCEVVAHGMEKAMGLTKSELEEELNTFRFHERLIPHNAHALRAIATRCIDADFVDDPSSDVRCTIAMRRETADSKRRHVSREDA